MSKKSEQLTCKILYVVILVLVFLVLVSPFGLPIVFAASVSLALFPLLLKLENKGFKRPRAAVLLTVLFTIVISIPLFFFVIKGAVVVSDQLEKIQSDTKMRDQGVTEIVKDLRSDVVNTVHGYAERFNQGDFLTRKKINTYLDTVINFLLEFFRGFAGNMPLFFLFLLIMILCTFSFLNYSHSIRNFFQQIFGFNDEKMNEIVKIFIEDSRQVYISNIATGGVQSLIVAIGAAILGIGSFFVIFFITLILSFIPVIGAAPVAFICAGIAFIQGENTSGIILLVLGGFTGVIDNILRPWLATMGESSIPPIVAFICVLGGALLLGFPGLFLGLLVGSVAFDTLPIFWKEIAKSTEESNLR